jgi:YegS/Rv2252/BmrU family lipid kinase
VKTLFLVNARSGARRPIDVPALIRDAFDGEYELRPCERIDDLDATIASAARDGFGVVYAVGGDGTVHEIAKRVAGTGLALGVLPTGSGNGFARHIGLPMDLRASLRTCRGQRVMAVDTAEVNGRAFLGVMGVGFDAVIAHRFAERAARGFRTYLQVGARAFLGYRDEEYDIAVDGQTLRRRAFLVTVANSSQYGNGATIAPGASMQDGILDVVLIDRVSIFRAPFLLARLFRKTLHRSSAVTIVRGRTITIRREREGPAHLDGEPVTLGDVLEVRVKAGALKVLVPDSCGGV